MTAGGFDAKLPFIRREAVKVLKAAYADKAAAFKGIEDGLTGFYRRLPDVPKASVDRAIATAQHAVRAQRVPVDEGDLGHVRQQRRPQRPGPSPFPGCFRCHDENHKTKQGKAISQDCSLCHTIE